jgi:uncharacterized protein (TIGR02996 family)
MNVEAALLEDVRDNPLDDGPRLVLADWLEDDGRPERAELIRAHCELARLRPEHRGVVVPQNRYIAERGHDVGSEPRCVELDRLVRRLITRLAPAPRCGHRTCVFRRGLIEELDTTGGNLAPAAPIFAGNAVRRLNLARWRGLGVAVAGSPGLESVELLTLGEAGAADLRVLGESPHLRRLRRLYLHRQTVPDLLGLLAGPGLPPLTELAVNGHLHREVLEEGGLGLSLLSGPPDLDEAGARALMRAPALGAVVGLNLYSCRPAPALLRALAEAPLPSLRRLRLHACALDAAGARALAQAPWFGQLTALLLSGSLLGAEGLRALAEAPAVPRLTRLELFDSRLDAGAVEALARSPLAARLEALDLRQNVIGDRGALALAHSPLLGNLRELVLGRSGVGNAGALALAESPHLGRLTALQLFESDLSPEAREALQRRFGVPDWRRRGAACA